MLWSEMLVHAQRPLWGVKSIAYRTSDGGAHWLGTAIALPAR